MDDKAIVLNTSSGCYYELDSKACHIWKLIEKDYGNEEIISFYEQKFSISRKKSIEALEEFISQAKNEGFLE